MESVGPVRRADGSTDLPQRGPDEDMGIRIMTCSSVFIGRWRVVMLIARVILNALANVRRPAPWAQAHWPDKSARRRMGPSNGLDNSHLIDSGAMETETPFSRPSNPQEFSRPIYAAYESGL